MIQNDFKLIAVIPLKDCDTNFRKNLKIGQLYQFFKGYDITLKDDNSSVISVVQNLENSAPKNLYVLENGINLNFSAVVGKNGTGKSTIFELLYYFIYVLSQKKTVNNRVLINTISDDLKLEKSVIENDYRFLESFKILEEKIRNGKELSDLEVQMYFDDYIDLDLFLFELIQKYKLISFRKTLLNRSEIYKYVKEELLTKINNLDIEIENEVDVIEPLINSSLNLSILYSSNLKIKEVRLYEGKISFNEFSPDLVSETNTIENFNLSDFFYTISLNYSHHGLNSRTIGKWINKLFHKNDGYTTPVVINPMRNSGNFDINQEMRLSKERLMSTVVFDLVNGKETPFLGKYKVSKFIFTIKKNLSPKSLEFSNTNFITNLESGFIFKNKLKIDELDDNIDYWDYAITYLERKISKVDEHYDFLIHPDKTLFDSKDELQNFILSDQSHITKKIRQVINFLRVTYDNRDFWKMTDEIIQVEFDKDKMLDWLNLFNIDFANMKPAKLIEYALPGFFNIDFELEYNRGDKIQFGNLSSGEQQMIFNINSISYHLYNLQSIHQESATELNKPNGNTRVNYRNVNIILDEIELYYHPEMQRQLVKNLIGAFETIKKINNKGIQSINVCLMTHSPFILSDIPLQNILQLDDDNDKVKFKDQQTFGANIHDTLIDNFFMNATIGEFSMEMINKFLSKVNNAILNRKNKKPLLLKRSLKEIENLGGEEFIKLIGDPLVKDKLHRMYFIATEINDKEAMRKYYQTNLDNLT